MGLLPAGRRASWYDPGSFWTGEYYNENVHKNHVYHHEYVITRDELPNLATYPLD